MSFWDQIQLDDKKIDSVGSGSFWDSLMPATPDVQEAPEIVAPAPVQAGSYGVSGSWADPNENQFVRKAKDIGAGFVGTIGDVGQALQIPHAMASFLPGDVLGKWISDAVKPVEEKLTVEDPTFMDKLATGGGSLLSFMIPGMAASKAINVGGATLKASAFLGTSISALTESAVEGGGVFETNKAQGMDEKEAAKRATATFFANIPVNYILDKWMFNEIPNGPKVTKFFKGMIAGGAQESAQESIQQMISNVATDRPLLEGVPESAAIGGLLGGGVSGVRGALSKDTPEATMPAEQQVSDVPGVQTVNEVVPNKGTSSAMEELNRAYQAKEIDDGIYKLGSHLLTVDPNFDTNSTLEVVNAIRLATPEIIKAEGYDPEGGAYSVAGETVSKFEKDNVSTAIKLYKGADSDTLVEEWYHRFYDRLSAEDRSTYEEYYKGSGDSRKINEKFAQEGRDYFFSEKLHEKAGGIRGLFDKAKESLKALVGRVRDLRGANIDQRIQELYKAAGTTQELKQLPKIEGVNFISKTSEDRGGSYKVSINPTDQRFYGEGAISYTGKPSMTNGPIDVIYTEEGELLVEDGWHRIQDAKKRGDKTIDANLYIEGNKPALDKEQTSFQIKKLDGVEVGSDYVKITDYNAIPKSKWDEVSKFMKRSGYDYRGGDDAKELYQQSSTGVFNDDQAEALKKAFNVNDKVEPKNKTVGLKEAAKKYFGKTDNFNEAGYLLTDGSMLDFSGKKDGGPPNVRYMDHREVQSIDGFETDMYSFMEEGNVRMKTESGGFEVSRQTTVGQRKTLSEYIDNLNGEVIVDLTNIRDGVFKSTESIEYPAGTSAEKIFKDIDNYYGGKQITPKSKILEARSFQLKNIDTPEFKNWFSNSKVVDEKGNPKVVYSGHSNIELYGNKYNEKKATAGGFFATDSPEMASNYAVGKIRVKEYYENGLEYRLGKNLNKKIWQIDLDEDQQKKAYDFILNETGQDFKKYIEDNKNYDKDVRRWSYQGLGKLQNIYDFMNQMGDTISHWDNNVRGKSNFDDLLDTLGIKNSNYYDSRGGVFPVYLNIKNPIDTSEKFPEDLLKALEDKAKRERYLSESETRDLNWTSEYPLRNWIKDIKQMDQTGEETFWSTHIPKKALPIIKQFGYDGIKDTGGKGGGQKHAVWIAFNGTQIKSIHNKTFNPEDQRMSYQLKKLDRKRYETVLKDLKKSESDAKRLAYRLARLPDEVQAQRLALELELDAYDNGPTIERIIAGAEEEAHVQQRFHPLEMFKGRSRLIYVPEQWRGDMQNIIEAAPGKFTFDKTKGTSLDVLLPEIADSLGEPGAIDPNVLIDYMDDAVRKGYMSDNDIKQKAIEDSLEEIKALKSMDAQKKIDWLSDFNTPGSDLFINNLSTEELQGIIDEAGINITPEEVKTFIKAKPEGRDRILSKLSQDPNYQVQGQKTLMRKRSESLDKMRSLIIDYAKKSGLTGEPYDTVATMVKNVKSTASLKKSLDKIDVYVEAKELNRAKKDLREIIKSEKKRIRGLKGKSRGKIDATYNDRLEEYITQFDYISDNKQKEIQNSMEYFQNQSDEDMPLSVKKDIIRLTRQNIDALSLEDINEIIDNINTIKKLGKLKYEIKLERENAEIEQNSKQSADMIRQYASEIGKDVKTPIERTFEEDTTVEVVGKKIAKYFIANLRPERLLQSFTGFKSSPLISYLHKNLLNSENDKLQNIENATKKIQEIHSGLDLNNLHKKLMTAQVMAGKDVKTINITFNQAMAVYAYSQSETGTNHLIGTGLSEENIKRIVNTLPKQYKDSVDKMIDYYDEYMYPRLNEEFKKEHGVSMPKIERYFPIKLLDTPKVEDDLMAEMLARFGNRAGVEKGFTKARTGSKARFKSIDYLGTMVGNVMSGEHYLAFNGSIRTANRMLNNEELKSAMEGFSPESTNQIKDWIKAVSRGKVETPPDPSGVNKFLDMLRTNYAMSVLGLNIVTILKQPASMVQGLAQVNKGEAVKASLTFMSHPVQTNAFVDSKSIMMRNRMNSFEREMAEIAEKRSSRTMLGSRSAKDYLELQMLPMAITDKIATDILWLAKYNEVMNSKGVESQAIEEADAVIRKTQSMGGILHISALHRGGGVARMFTMFTNQLNQNANLLYEMQKTWGLKTGRRRLEEIALYAIVPALMEYLASNGFDLLRLLDDPEGATKAIVMNGAGGFPILNKAIDSVMSEFGNATREGRGLEKQRIFTDMLPAPIATVQDVIEAITADGFDKKLIKGIEAAGKLTGVATAQPKRLMKGFEAFQESGDPRNLIWSQAALGNSQKNTFKRKILKRR